jgi:hypothetical protein
MPAPKKLKVFRTPIGFHDAYVAAPSQKAALEAWGAESNLFAQGIAEAVTDPALMKAPLARPGEVVRVARGSTAEHVRALGEGDKPRPRAKAANDANDEAGAKPSTAAGRTRPAPPKKRPRPSREPLEKAEAALARVEDEHRAEIAAIRKQQEALEQRRHDIEQQYRQASAKLNDQVEAARAAYRKAMADWAS